MAEEPKQPRQPSTPSTAKPTQPKRPSRPKPRRSYQPRHGKEHGLNLNEMLGENEIIPKSPSLFTELAAGVIDQFTGEAERRRPKVEMHPAQQAFLDCPKPFRGFAGGRGAGKSFAGCLDLIQRAKAGRLYMVIGPSYSSVRDSTFRSFIEVAYKLQVLVKKNKTDFYAIIKTRDGGQCQVNFRSADDPEKLRGPNLSGCFLDEASVMKKEVVNIVVASLREEGELGFLSMAFTPKGKHHWSYGWYFDSDDKPKDRTQLFCAAQKDNPFLSEEFREAIASIYVPGSTIARQEQDGEFVDLVGMMFRREWFNLVTRDKRPRGDDVARVRYWDKAGSEGKGDYSAGVLVSRTPGGMFTVEHVARGQWSAHHRNEMMKITAAKDAKLHDNNVTIWVEQEPGSGGKESAEITLREMSEFPVFIDRVRGNKQARALPFQAAAEAGMIQVVELIGKLGTNINYVWTRDFLDELCAFPEGAHDDQVDAVCGAYTKLLMGHLDTTYGDSTEVVAYPEVQRGPAEKVKIEQQSLMDYFRERAGVALSEQEAEDPWVVLLAGAGGQPKEPENGDSAASPAEDIPRQPRRRQSSADRYADWLLGD